MTNLRLSIASENYDRIQALKNGEVRIPDFELVYTTLKPKELFKRVFLEHEFDITEISFSSYMLNFAKGSFPYRALPIPLSRVFPHSSIYVRTDRGIDAPADLKGKLVGLPNWNFTRGLVVKGMLQDDYGLRQSDIRWRVGPVDAPNDSTYSVRATPPGVHIEDVAAGSHLSAELADGRIDAIIDARAPRAFMDGAPKVGRLFPDFRPVEQEWYRRTGIFPTMHLVAVRIELLERYPSLALEICNAFQRSKESCRPALSDLDALAVMLPWLVAETEATERLMGNDYWPYGMPRNRRMIEAQTRWSFQQGLTERQLSAADLFAPGTLDWAP